MSRTRATIKQMKYNPDVTNIITLISSFTSSAHWSLYYDYDVVRCDVAMNLTFDLLVQDSHLSFVVMPSHYRSQMNCYHHRRIRGICVLGRLKWNVLLSFFFHLPLLGLISTNNTMRKEAISNSWMFLLWPIVFRLMNRRRHLPKFMLRK